MSITTESLHLRLCSHDPRNPISADLLACLDDDDARPEVGGDCGCDNCFYGRHGLADELLRQRACVVELIDAAQWALRLDDAGAMSDTARHNLENALVAMGGDA